MINYKTVFEDLVNSLKCYVVDNGLESLVLGISGGIDSTVVSAIAHEVSKDLGIPFIGRSITIKNKKEESDTSSLVGHAFCTDFRKLGYGNMFERLITFTDIEKSFYQTKNKIGDIDFKDPIALGNIQARVRMIHLYYLAGIRRGIVLSTDNRVEWLLGFWTIHGDVGDFNPLFGLYKTEVYGLAEYLLEYYKDDETKTEAIIKSISLVPTDGLGISNSDLEQIGANSYGDVENILKTYLGSNKNREKTIRDLKNNIKQDVIEKVIDRHERSEFKRKALPIVIDRKTNWFK